MKIVILCGGRRRQGYSQRVAKDLMRRLQSKKIDVFLADNESFELPLFEERLDRLPEMETKFSSVVQKFQLAEAFLFVSPEYNGGYSAALKNYIDTLNPEVFKNKPVGVVTVSAGALGGIRAAYQIQQLVLALFAFPQPQMLMVPTVNSKFDEQDKIKDKEFETKIDSFIETFLKNAEP